MKKYLLSLPILALGIYSLPPLKKNTDEKTTTPKHESAKVRSWSNTSKSTPHLPISNTESTTEKIDRMIGETWEILPTKETSERRSLGGSASLTKELQNDPLCTPEMAAMKILKAQKQSAAQRINSIQENETALEGVSSLPRKENTDGISPYLNIKFSW